MDKFVVMNNEGKFGVSVERNGFAINSKNILMWTPNVNEATLFTALLFRNIDATGVVAKIPAEETRVVKLLGKN